MRPSVKPPAQYRAHGKRNGRGFDPNQGTLFWSITMPGHQHGSSIKKPKGTRRSRRRAIKSGCRSPMLTPRSRRVVPGSEQRTWSSKPRRGRSRPPSRSAGIRSVPVADRPDGSGDRSRWRPDQNIDMAWQGSGHHAEVEQRVDTSYGFMRGTEHNPSWLVRSTPSSTGRCPVTAIEPSDPL